MIIRLLTIDEFYAAFPRPLTVYGSRAFIELNAHRADAVRCLAGFDEKGEPRLGIVLGYRAVEWLAPFSAPFSEIAYRKPQSLERIYEFLTELSHTLAPAPVRITLPPPIYDPEMDARITGVAANMAQRTAWDYNYHYPLAQMAHFVQRLSPQARRHHKRAMAQGFEFCPTTDIAAAYSVIESHHRDKGYRMAMSLADVEATARVVPSHFFLVRLGTETVAAAYMQQVAESGIQLINWGDMREHTESRPMNFLAYKLCEHFAALGMSTLDFGPASTAGIPNAGLCRFKESLGCTLTLKPTFTL